MTGHCEGNKKKKEKKSPEFTQGNPIRYNAPVKEFNSELSVYSLHKLPISLCVYKGGGNSLTVLVGE